VLGGCSSTRMHGLLACSRVIHCELQGASMRSGSWQHPQGPVAMAWSLSSALGRSDHALACNLGPRPGRSRSSARPSLLPRFVAERCSPEDDVEDVVMSYERYRRFLASRENWIKHENWDGSGTHVAIQHAGTTPRHGQRCAHYPALT